MCFDKILGLQDCYNTEDAPIGGLYLDKLTGITPEELDQVICKPYLNGYGLFVDKREAAGRLVSADVVNKLRGTMKADTITNNETIGYVNEGVPTTAIGAGIWTGIKMEMRNPDSFLDLYFSNLSLLLPGITADTEIKIFDLDTTLEITSFNLVPNIRTFKGITIPNPRGVKRIAIVYESTEAATRTTIRPGYTCGTCSGTSRRMWNIDPYIWTSGVQLTLDGGGNVATQTFAQYTYGLLVDYSVSCSRSSWLCSISQDLALPLAYMTAAQIMEYSIHNASNVRVNNTVKYNAENNANRYAAYMGAYNQQISNVLKHMRMPTDQACFHCNRTTVFDHFAI